MEGLPLLPGYTFETNFKFKHHVPHHFVFQNGYPYPKNPKVGLGGSSLDTQGCLYVQPDESLRYEPALTYGRSQPYVPPVFQPHYLRYDKKCLTFNAFFRQSVLESTVEYYRTRFVKIIYFLEDDTITVVEPLVPNSGLPQGRLVKRGRLPKYDLKELWHWKDFNVGMEMEIYGVVYHICSADKYTKEYMESQGIELNPEQAMPSDPYIQKREAMAHYFRPPEKKDIREKEKQLFLYDRKVLRFYAVSDERASENGDLKHFKILYYLQDDTMDIIELRPKTSSDQAICIRKVKVPKGRMMPADYPGVYLERSEEHVVQYHSPVDFIIGKTVSLLSRRYFLYDCDNFTRNFYKNLYQIDQPKKMEIPETKKTEKHVAPLPPYTGFGSYDDFELSRRNLIPKRPKKDMVRYLLNISKKLRYTAVMDWDSPEDVVRQFIIEYRLSDGTIQILELPVRNSGFLAGRFLANTLILKPGTDLNNPEIYSPHDFTIGSVIHVFGHRFRITGIDLSVYRYMETNPDKFSPEMIQDARKYLTREGKLIPDIKHRTSSLQTEMLERPCIEGEEEFEKEENANV